MSKPLLPRNSLLASRNSLLSSRNSLFAKPLLPRNSLLASRNRYSLLTIPRQRGSSRFGIASRNSTTKRKLTLSQLFQNKKKMRPIIISLYYDSIVEEWWTIRYSLLASPNSTTTKRKCVKHASFCWDLGFDKASIGPRHIPSESDSRPCRRCS